MAGKYKLVVLSNAAQGQEDTFNEWYDKTHLRDVLRIDGIVSAQRFRMADTVMADPLYRYCTIYEVEGMDPAAVVGALSRAPATGAMPISDALDPRVYAVLYEEIGPVVRA